MSPFVKAHMPFSWYLFCQFYTVAGKGNSHYNGIGILARLDLLNNIYFDASARLGNASSDFFTSDLTKLSNFSFDYSTTYYGSHAGL
ncbi:MAG: hypothetical protein LBP57_05510, partial [Endomicrobium sp.]|nr:hypothetical protein [Endomicrobium sp.]